MSLFLNTDKKVFKNTVIKTIIKKNTVIQKINTHCRNLLPRVKLLPAIESHHLFC